MNKPGSLHTKHSIFTIAGLGIIILGLGFFSLALINIVLLRGAVDNTYTESSAPSVILDHQVQAPVTENIQLTVYAKILETPIVDKILYPEYPAEGDDIGTLTLPTLELELPIIQGTGTDELKEGVGHFLQSVLPGEEDNCVLSAHRDTLFERLGELVIGDQLIVKTSAGTFTYEVSGTKIVDKDDKTVIVPTDHAVLTLTTCYPFNYIGSAPERYIVSADLVLSE